MLPPLIDIRPFCAAIEADELILTSNQRLAAKITQAWGERMARENHGAWQAPRVFAIEHWLAQCWEQLQDQNHSLTHGLAIVGKQQSAYYWERAISQQTPDLIGSYTKTAEKTLAVLQNWQLAPELVEGNNPSVVQFKAWAAAYAQLLKRNGLVTVAESWQLVHQGFAASALPEETSILLYGFQSMPPLQTAVLEKASTRVNSLSMQAPTLDATDQTQPCDVGTLACADSRQELNVAANWAASQLAANPHQRIGLVIPDLNHRLQASMRQIDEALQGHGIEIPVNVSAGVPLTDTPLIQGALQLLGMLRHKRPLQEWLDCLYSPYSLFAQLPIQVRTDIELSLRATRRFEFTLDQFVAAMRASQASEQSEPESTLAPVLEPLVALQQRQRLQATGLKSFTGWAAYFAEFLETFGWPGSRAIDSLEYQQRQQWKNTLEQLTELDNLNFEVGLTKASTYLQQLAQDRVFHPQTGDAPLQVLGLLEASGLRFDQLWILGMSSQKFPSSVAINPMLPAELQRQQQMPHALPQRELEIAKDLLRGFQANSQRLILSYPEFADEEQLDPSPVIRHLPALGSPDFAPLVRLQPQWLQQRDVTEVFPDPGPSYHTDQERIKGGASLLKNQSACPFNAFAIHRLWAEPLEQPSHGLSAADRGSILHEIMYRLWGQWQNSARLQALSEQQIHQQLNDTVVATLARFAPEHRVLQGAQYLRLEQQRLCKLIGQWLEEELRRPAFEVIALEQQISVNFADLNLTMRLDRVDRIADKTLIIDYKTGEVTPGNWLGPRPKDPQLPLYLLASDPQANGCAFAQIKGGKIGFIGHSDSQLIQEKKPIDDWSAQIAQWQQALSGLAAEFVSGHATVEVFDQTAFRHQAYLLPLNRWHEQNHSQGDRDNSAQQGAGS